MDDSSITNNILLELKQRAIHESCSIDELLKRLLTQNDLLQVAEAKTQTLLRTTWYSFTLIDTEYRVIDLSEYAKENSKTLFGRSMKQGDIVTDFLPAHTHESFKHNFGQALLGKTITVDRVLQDIAGNDHFFEITLYPITNKSDVAIGVCMSYHDITHRRQIQQAFNQSEARLRSLVDTQSAFVVRCDLEGHYTYTNLSFSTRYEWFVESLIGHSLLETVVPDDRDKALATGVACLAEPGKPIQVILRKITSDDSMFWTLWEFVAIKDWAGTVNEIQCIGFDITKQVEAENARLEQAELRTNLKKEQAFNALVQKVVYALAHDVRIPLAVIGSAKNMLDRYYHQLDDEGRHEKLDRIGHQLRYVTEMLDEVVMAVRGGLNQQTFKPMLLNLKTLCQVSIHEIQETNGRKHRLHFVTDDSVQTVMVDETLINRILLNLLSNAVKFSPVNSDICLELRRREDWIVLRVTDYGMGISEADQQHLFEPFYRADAAKPIPGTGLGLSIVKECVERHQGTISVQTKLGEGTSFTVELPFQVENVRASV